MNILFLFLFSLFCSLSLAAAEFVYDPAMNLGQVDVEAGETTFRIHCARCHGMKGEGGEGTNLNRPRLRHARDDAQLFDVITTGIDGTGMPSTLLTNREIYQAMAYVRSLGRVEQLPPPGDAVRGETLYWNAAGCAACHIVAGKGVGVGPELSDVGARRGTPYLLRALSDPRAEQPRGTPPMEGPYAAYLTVRVHTEDGRVLEGMRVNEDAFSILLRDLNGTVHSFSKAGLTRLEKLFGHSLMPGYESELTTEQVNDIVSYLMTLEGEP